MFLFDQQIHVEDEVLITEQFYMVCYCTCNFTVVNFVEFYFFWVVKNEALIAEFSRDPMDDYKKFIAYCTGFHFRYGSFF